jgi:hypothetical protein
MRQKKEFFVLRARYKYFARCDYVNGGDQKQMRKKGSVKLRNGIAHVGAFKSRLVQAER